MLALVGFGIYRLVAPSGTPASGPGAGPKSRQSPPQPVGAATIGRGDVRAILNALGTVTPLATVTVKTQINGQLVQIAFKEGQIVHKGDFLAQIDPRPYQVALESGEGALARDQALLKNAQLDLVRYQTLVRQDSISRQQLDTQASLVQQYVGTVKTDQATIDTAKLNLVYCHITAPVTGRVGLRQVDEGNYVQTSDANGIVVITQLQPISVIFALPEDNVAEITRQAPDGTGLPVMAFDRSDSHLLSTGRLETIDNQIDTTTGTVKFRALFDNADNALFPNQFVNAKLVVETLRNVVVAPTAAIQRGEPGTFVYVIRPDNTVHVQPVKLGPTDGDKVAIVSGLNEGDRVVTDGADRLREGAKVTIPPPPAAQGGGQAPSAAQGGSQAPGQGSTQAPDEQGSPGQGQHRHRGHRQQQGQQEQQ
ncbi:MAG: MdtA/MuxA family multidrug efflux RND transporter periplasmic adaptor subunit [Acetobacteraceae bacterium]|nr:MdtA/MuxA family multidrug efflux RND transporter periplasmic adaptor subunit [Acetobacteraceae bacterium]